MQLFFVLVAIVLLWQTILYYRRMSTWNRVLSRHFEELRKRSLHNIEWGEYSLFGAYAAVNEAEFFAVASERFFQRPSSLKKHFLDIYKELEEFYGLDTAELFYELG